MMKVAMVVLAGLGVAACEKCNAPPNVNAGIGVGTGGVSGGVSVGKSCGPGYISIGTGSGYYVNW